MTSSREQQDRYCRHALPQVSRTFALNIRLLRGPLGEAVRVGYLLCRVADTLEDAWPDGGAPAGERFDLFSRALQGERGAAETLASLVPAAADSRPAGALGSLVPAAADARVGSAELDLVRHAPLVFGRLALLPEPDRRVLQEGVGALATGMRRFVERAPTRGARAYLEDEEELRAYCYTVAGCVGEMLTRLYLQRAAGAAARWAAELKGLAPRFGEGLQLTNILLDLSEDLRRARCYVPQAWLDAEGVSPSALGSPAHAQAAARVTARLETLALAGLDQAWRYTLLIPRRHWRYRLFCAWPVLWAAASLAEVRRAPGFVHGGRRPRIARSRVRALAMAAAGLALSNGALARLYQRVRPAEAAPQGWQASTG